MLLTINDTYTENPDERVSLDVEVLAEYRLLQRASNVVNDLTTRPASVSNMITNTHNKILAMVDTSEVPVPQRSLTLVTVGSPTIVVRGSKIEGTLQFDCELRSRYNPDGLTPETMHVSYWQIHAKTTRWGGLTTYQEEQLIMRYQQDILAILEDVDSHNLYLYYTANKWLELLEKATTELMFSLDTVREHIAAVADGDFADNKE